MGRFIAVLILLWLMQLDTVAQAQTLRLALFKTASSASEDSQLAAALDPVLQTEIGRMPKVSVAALPPLDLPSLQLALDCVGEAPSCLAVATERSKVDGLVSPNLARSGATLVLSLLLYDPMQSKPIKLVTRSFAGDASDALVIEGARSLVQELFGQAAPVTEPVVAPAAEPEPAAPAPAPEPAALEPDPQPLAADQSAPRGSQSLLLPIVLGAAGLSAIAIGIGFGAASNSSESRYAKTHVADSAEAQQASELLSTARTQSSIANVAVVLGAASCVAGGVVFFLRRNRHPDTAPNARVALGPGFLSVSGGF